MDSIHLHIFAHIALKSVQLTDTQLRHINKTGTVVHEIICIDLENIR